ncbi:hypothetical protein RclHR1_12340001 [Rhizophagus clarus]|uniref:NrS-1 polymerase-like helicase domain-containing protein n=1 Tax=Rhizophagus clarus TaxID=94130 RepID=A0A2Z6Q6X3_9GLOM|nr:hypothetical protein RclHR1_12340001 [Rhizophagus clarus]
MTQSLLSEFLDASAPYYQGYKTSDIGASLYKIQDDSVKPRHFLGADNADEIEAILTEREDHSLHEFIDGDEPLRPVIDFDLPIETLNAITPKLSDSQAKNSLCCAFRNTCLEVAMFTKLVRKKLLTALQGNSIIDNIASKCSFSLRMLGSPKYNKKTEEHIHVKKAIRPKDRSVFDFMICPPNDESKVIENSPLLVVPKAKMRDPGTRNPTLKFTINETTLDREKKLSSPTKLDQSRISDPNDCFVWGDLIDMCTSGKYEWWYMAPKLDLAKYEVNLIELGGEGVKLINLIDQAVTKGLILYHNINFLPYSLNSPVPNTKFFNLFIGFLAKPAVEINPEIMDPILWHTKNIIREHLHYATSDLEKILGRFNSPIQARKLIVMNETKMSSGEWHKFNGHLKSLITERMVSIEHRVVCFDVCSRCRGNTAYFKRLRNVLNHPNASGVVMKYLLSRDFSDFELQEIPATKMKEEIMRDQLPNPIRFLIYYLVSWSEAKLCESGLGDIKEFSDIPQPDLPENKTTDIPIFNVPEIIPPKIILTLPERQADRKNAPPSKDKKADKQDDSTQALFNYVAEDIHALVTSTSGIFETSKIAEPLIDSPETSKLLDSKPSSNELSMKTDSRMCGWAEELEEDLKEYMDMKVRERLIREKIICREFENDGIISFWLDTDEEWKKIVSILQENGMLW